MEKALQPLYNGIPPLLSRSLPQSGPRDQPLNHLDLVSNANEVEPPLSPTQFEKPSHLFLTSPTGVLSYPQAAIPTIPLPNLAPCTPGNPLPGSDGLLWLLMPRNLTVAPTYLTTLIS